MMAEILLIAGCATSKYQVLDLQEELNYTKQIAEQYQPDLEWWKQYNNQELNRLVESLIAWSIWL